MFSHFWHFWHFWAIFGLFLGYFFVFFCGWMSACTCGWCSGFCMWILSGQSSLSFFFFVVCSYCGFVDHGCWLAVSTYGALVFLPAVARLLCCVILFRIDFSVVVFDEKKIASKIYMCHISKKYRMCTRIKEESYRNHINICKKKLKSKQKSHMNI